MEKLNLSKFFQELSSEEYSIMKYDGIEDYKSGSDIDIFVKNVKSFIRKIITVGNQYISKGYQINVHDHFCKHSYVDFCIDEKIEFRFDIYENFKMYKNVFICPEYFNEILNNSGTIQHSFEGKSFNVKILSEIDELVFRYLEYVDWFQEREDKIKHLNFIIKSVKK